MWKTKNQINNTSGIHQGDNMSSILFIFIIQGFIDTYMPTTKQAEFRSSPNIKMEMTTPLMVDYLTNQPNQKERPST
jgi:hypothetical protein